MIKKKIKNVLLKKNIIGFAYLSDSFIQEKEFSDMDIGIYILFERYKKDREIDISKEYWYDKVFFKGSFK